MGPVRATRPTSTGTGAVIGALIGSSIYLAACGDPSIQVQFEIPGDYRSDVASAVLRVLEPTGLEPFDCDDIAFDRVSEDAERASLRQEIVVRAGDTIDLSGIPRLGEKLFWVQGLSADNQIVLAGCARFGDISGQSSVTVVGQPTTVVTAALTNQIGAPLPDRIELFVTDIGGRPLSDIDVTWTTVASSSSLQTGAARTRDGAVEITPGRPALPGPALLDIRARWQQIALPPISGFEPVEDILQVALPGTSPGDDGAGLARTDALYTVGPIGPEGQMGFAALGPVAQTDNQRQVLIAYHDPGAGSPPFQTVISDPINNLAAFASIVRLDRGARDTVIVSSGGQWHEVNLSGQVVPFASPGDITKKLIQAGSCERDSDMLLAVVSPLGGDDSLIAIDPQGQQVASVFTDGQLSIPIPVPTSVQPLAAGCVSGIDDTLYRTVVFHTAGAVRPFIAHSPESGSGPHLGEIVSFAGNVGFIPEVGDNPAVVMGVGIDIDGASISRYQLALGGPGEIEPLLIAEDPSLTFVRAMRGGDIDGDGRPDVAALLDFGLDDQQRSRTRLQMIMGTEYLGQRLIGVSPELSGTDPQLYVADFDGDGSDDLLLADRKGATIVPGIRQP